MTGSTGEDWAVYQAATPSTAGLDFAIVKATEGTGYVNPRYASQIATGRAHGLVVGHYHFARPGSMAAQLTYFLAHTTRKPGDVLAFDWEDTAVSAADKDAWIKAAQAAAPGHRVLLYCNRDFWLNRDMTTFAGDGLWIADPDQPAGKPAVESPYVIHQYSEAGGVDHNYSPMTPTQLRAWATNQTPEVDPVAHDPLTAADDKSLWQVDNVIPAPTGLAAQADAKTNKFYTPTTHMQLQTQNAIEANVRVQQLATEVADLKAQVATLVAALTDPAGFIAQVVAGLPDIKITVTPKES